MRMERRWNGKTAGERREVRRHRLITAARELYGQNGFHATGVRAVCQAAGLTERYFYENFENSEALLEAAYREQAADLVAHVRAADVPDAPPELRLRRMLAAYYGDMRDKPNSSRVFLIEIIGINPAIDKAFDEAVFALTEPILEVLDPQRIGPMATSAWSRRGISGGLLHIAIGWVTSDYSASLDDIIEAALPLCLLARPALPTQPV